MNKPDPRHMTENMSKSSGGAATIEGPSDHPHKGDRFRCSKCGMEIEVRSDCRCPDDHAHFHCCGQEMNKA